MHQYYQHDGFAWHRTSAHFFVAIFSNTSHNEHASLLDNTSTRVHEYKTCYIVESHSDSFTGHVVMSRRGIDKFDLSSVLIR